MRNIALTITIFCFLGLLSSCELDNFEAPDAQIYGAIRDIADGSLIEQDMFVGSRIWAYEHGYENAVAQPWDFMCTGEYRNNLVFSNTYDIELRSGNYFPMSYPNIEIKPGENELDFTVTPYLRIKDTEIVWDQDSSWIVATFRVEASDPSVNLFRISLFAHSDMYVGMPIRFTLVGEDAEQTYKPPIAADPVTVYSLKIDLDLEEKTFLSGRDYFFRIGALAAGDDLSSVKYNYAPAVKIDL